LQLGDVQFFDASGLFADILVGIPRLYSPFWRGNLLSTESLLSGQFLEVLGDAIAKSVGFVNDS
jgi:inosine/xanthosine triphosphate pyrophosphatase family protein